MPALKDVQDDVVVANQSALRYADCTRLAKIILKDFLGESGDHPDDDAPEKEHDVQDTGDLPGIGYIPSAENNGLALLNRQESTATQDLRKQLLGKRSHASGSHAARQQVMGGLSHQASKPRPRIAPTARKELSDDDDRDGRSGLGKKSHRTIDSLKDKSSHARKDGDGNEATESQTLTDEPMVTSKKHKGSYLDQLLAERAVKKRKRQKGPT